MCATDCRVTHLTRTVHPDQLNSLLEEFDGSVRTAFEKLIGHGLENTRWRIARLPPKSGGLALRTGLTTAGAQHATSLVKNAGAVRNFSDGAFDLETEVGTLRDWLSSALGKQVDVKAVIAKIENGEKWRDGSLTLSLQQKIEAVERSRVEKSLTSEEQIHLKAISGTENHWITVMPLVWKGYNFLPTEWVAAARKRLRVPVASSRAKCSHCRSGWCDIYGNHQGSCPGGDLIQRHNAVRDLVHQAAKSAGFCSGLEFGGSLDSAERPGDVVIFGLIRRLISRAL